MTLPGWLVSSRGRIRREPLICLALLAVAAAVYGRVGGFEFVGIDDDRYVFRNSHIREGLTFSTFVWALTAFEAANWHPLTWISHALDIGIFGIAPAGHHLVSSALHAVNALLLFLLLERLTGRTWRSAAVAALFAAHPINVESVAWVAERKNVLSTTFWLTSTIAYLWHLRRPSAARYTLALCLFALGLAAKPMLVTLPVTLLLLDGWPLGRLMIPGRGSSGPARAPFSPRRLVALTVEKIPYFALSAVSSALTVHAQHSGGALMEPGFMQTRLANAVVSYAAYLKLALWPAGLAIFYPHPGPWLPGWKVAGAALLLSGATGLAIAQWRRRPFLAAGWLWYLVTLVPVIGIVQVGRQAMADRYAYVPLLGVFVATAWVVPGVAAPLPRAARTCLLTAVFFVPLAVFASCGMRQASFWRNEIALYERALAVTANNDYIHALIALPLFRQGRVDETLRHLQESLRINPANDAVENNVGLILLDRGRAVEAAGHFRNALKQNPANAKAHFNLARTLVADGRREEAVGHLREALRLEPDYDNPRRLLGQLGATWQAR